MFESPWVAVFGRAHFLLLHFPIALLLVGALLEFFRLFRFGERSDGPRTSAAGVACVVIGCLLAWLAGASGWVYADRDLGEGLWSNGFLSGDALDWHRWAAVATAVVCLPLLVLAIVSRSNYSGSLAAIYRVLLALTAVGVGLTGHLGGEMVHGRGFMLAPLMDEPPTARPDDPDPATNEGPAAPDTPAAEPPSGSTEGGTALVAFDPTVIEILEANCIRCHGAERQRGDIRLDSLEAVHSVISPGLPNDSRIAHVLRLPEDDPLHMPKNKPSLPEEQIRTIELWIEQLDAPESAPDPEAAPPESIPPDVPDEEDRVGKAPQIPADPPPTYTDAQLAARDEALLALHAQGAVARRISEQSQNVEVRVLERRGDFGDDDAALLLPLREFITALDLTGAAITDASLETIGKLHRLRALRIGETAIKGDGLSNLASLSRLERLDLHQTDVGAEDVQPLLTLPFLRTLHLWQTRVEPGELTDVPQHLSITGLNQPPG